MADLSKRLFDVGLMDTLSRMDSPVHRLDPRAKLATTLVFVGVVLSFEKYAVSAVLPFVLYPVFLLAAGRLPTGYLLKKMLLVAPFAVVIGIFNPILDTSPMIALGPVVISSGWVSFAAIMLRFVLTVGASLTLVAVTGFTPLLAAADRLGAPRVLTVQLMFFFRYLFVLAKETLRVLRARSLRAVGGRGLGLGSFGSLLGQLLLRTLDRAERVHRAMFARGFTGEIRLATPLAFRLRDGAFVAFWTALFVTLRLVNVPELVGGEIVEHLP